MSLIYIPEKFKKYSPRVIDFLIREGYFDDVDTIEDKFDNIDDSEFEIIEYPVKTIGMWMSGGADSSLCAWMLCKHIKDNNLDIQFQPLSVRRGRGWNPIYAGNVIDFIEDNLQFKMKDHIVYYPDKDDEYQREIKEFRDRDVDNFNSRLIDIMYSGITCNPPDSAGLSKNEERTRDEEADRPIESWGGFAYYINPFFNINKKDVSRMYDENGLTDKLFPLTRSCEGSDYETGNYTHHCGKCWWCEERLWAFGRLV